MGRNEVENCDIKFGTSSKRRQCAELVTICDQFQTASGSGLPADSIYRARRDHGGDGVEQSRSRGDERVCSAGLHADAGTTGRQRRHPETAGRNRQDAAGARLGVAHHLDNAATAARAGVRSAAAPHWLQAGERMIALKDSHFAWMTALWLAGCGQQFVAAAETAAPPGGGFVDVTRESGVAEGLARHYERHPKWWLSGVN